MNTFQQISAAFPLISVIIPVYNCEKMIGAALDSVFAQNYPNIEVIVVDDGSTDNSAGVIQAYSSLTYVYQDNAGPASARNRGLSLSKGAYIAFLDADDLWPQDNLLFLHQILKNNPNGQIVRGLIKWEYLANEDNYIEQEYLDEHEKTSFNVNLGALLLKKEVFEKIGLLDKELIFHEDTDFWNRVEYAGVKYIDVEKVSLIYRIHERNMTLDKKAFGQGMIRAFMKKKERLNGDKSKNSKVIRAKI